MRLISRKAAVLIVSGFCVAAFAVLLGWRLVRACDAGWAGLAYSPPLPQTARKLPDIPFVRTRSSAVLTVLPGGPAQKAGIAPDDVLVSIDGVPTSDTAGISRLDSIRRWNDVVTYRVRRGNAERLVAIRLISPLKSTVVVAVVTSALCFLVFVSVAVIVFWNRPKSSAARVFYWLCTTGALFFAAGTIAELDMAGLRGIAPMLSGAYIITYLAYAILSILMTDVLLHFALVFPKRSPILQQHPSLLIWIYTLTLLPAIVSAPMMVLIVSAKYLWTAIAATVVVVAIVGALGLRLRNTARSGGLWNAIVDHPLVAQTTLLLLMTLPIPLGMRALRAAGNKDAAVIFGMLLGMSMVIAFLLIFAAYSVGTIAALVTSYRTSTAEEKHQVRWPLWGTVVAVGTTLLFSFGWAILSSMSPSMRASGMTGITALIKVCYTIIPISFAFGILKYRLMEIDVIIKKTFVYSMATFEIGILYFVVVAWLGSWLTSHFHIRSQSVTVIGTLLLAALFVPIRTRAQRIIERRLNRARYDAAAADTMIRHEILRATDLHALLLKSAEAIQQALQASSVVVLVRDGSGRMTPQASIGVPDQQLSDLALETADLLPEEGIVRAGDLRLRQDDWLRMRKIHADLVVPLALRGDLHGAMIVGSPLGRSWYDDDDRAFLASVGEQIALAIDNLSVSDEVRDYERALEIQRRLLPASMPRIVGLDVDATWRPARIVGGDYFDVIPLRDSLAVCIGDVAGKGMPAALLMSSLQAAVRATLNDAIAPHLLCDRVRSVLGENVAGRFVTFFFAIVDHAHGVVRYTNAGHNPPMIVGADGSVRRLEGGGPAFARLMNGLPYATEQVPLGEGDTLVLFTDGVTEARNTDGEEFGEQRLIESVAGCDSAHSIVRTVVDRVTAFSSGIVHDDLTLVCVRVEPAPAIAAAPVLAEV